MKVVIMQGITGAGKTTMARNLGERTERVIVSADDYFPKGRYDARLLPKAHEQCKRRFIRAIKSRVSLVIVDNTNLLPWTYKFYVERAVKAGYEPILFRVLCSPEIAAKRGKHRANINMDYMFKAAERLLVDPIPLPYIEEWTA